MKPCLKWIVWSSLKLRECIWQHRSTHLQAQCLCCAFSMLLSGTIPTNNCVSSQFGAQQFVQLLVQRLAAAMGETANEVASLEKWNEVRALVLKEMG